MDQKTVANIGIINYVNQDVSIGSSPSFNNVSLSTIISNNEVFTFPPQGGQLITSGGGSGNFVDLTTDQSVNGHKTFIQPIGLNGGSIGYNGSSQVIINADGNNTLTVDALYTQSSNIRTNNIRDTTGGSSVNVNGDPITTRTNTQSLSHKTMDTGINTISMSGTNLTAIIDPNNKLLTSSTPSFQGLTVNGLSPIDLNSTNTKTLSNKTIDSSVNTISISNSALSSANINTLLDQPVLKTSDVEHNNISIAGTAIFKGPKTVLQANTCTTIGYDTLDQARITMFSPSSGVLGSLCYTDTSEMNTYQGKLEYDGITDQFKLYLAGNINSTYTIDPSYMLVPILRSNFIVDSNNTNTVSVNGLLVDLNSTNTKTISGKTISTTNNTINISSTPITDLISNSNPLLSSSSPTFSNLNLSGAANAVVSVVDNASHNSIFAVASNTSAYLTGSATGDCCIVNRVGSGNIIFGFGTGASPASMTLTTTQFLPIVPTVSTSTCQYTYCGLGVAPDTTGSARLKLAGYIENTGTVSVVSGAANILGNLGSCSISGTGMSMTLIITTGATGITTQGVVCTITLSIAAPDTAYTISITPKNAQAGLYNGKFYQTNISTTQFTLSNISVNLTTSATYTYGIILMS